MKKLFLLAGTFMLTATLFAQQPAAQATQKKAEDVIKFKELSYDFGKIKQGSPVTHDFNFTNTSDTPVIIESATPSCGCTTPIKPEVAIPKGTDNKITAAFNSANVDPCKKIITSKVSG